LDPIPYFSLPDDWANKAHCPVCSASPLVVMRRVDAPDQMVCPRCHSLFEIEEKGPRIHFSTLPGILTGILTGRWVTYAEVKQAVQVVVARQAAENLAAGALASQPVQLPSGPPEPSPFTNEMITTVIPAAQGEEQVEKKPEPAAPPPVQPPPVLQPRAPETKDVRTRAKDLYALGNRIDQIKAILSRDSNLDKAEIQAVVDNLYGEDEAKRSRQRTWLWVSIGIGLFILILCIVIALIWQTMLAKLPGGSGKNIVATISANTTVAPLLATPIVVREAESGAGRPTCPQTNGQASALFGGPADNWYADTQGGSWFLVTRTPVTVHVPGGMTAILVDIGGGGVGSVPGPASIINATSLSILCR
jgi:hypothetical protein